MQLKCIYDAPFIPWLKNNIQNNVPLMVLTARLTDAPYKSEVGMVIAFHSNEFSQGGIYTICAGSNGIEFKSIAI